MKDNRDLQRVNDKILRDMQALDKTDEQLYSNYDSQSFTKKTPQPPPNLSSKKLSAEASHKKELSDLDHKNKTLEKNYSKLLKKHTEVMEELKEMKALNESLVKDLNVSQKTIEKLNFEKTSLSSLSEDNKAYIRKLESRLVQGAKNQYLVEINNNLREECEKLKKELEGKSNEIDKVKKLSEKKTSEIKILGKALEMKLDEFKSKTGCELKTGLLLDIGQCKQETDDCKEKYEDTVKENKKLQIEIEKLNVSIQELTFSKEHLTELLVEAENRSHNSEVELESYKKHSTELVSERKMLREYIDKLTIDTNNKSDDLVKTTRESKSRIKELGDALKKLESEKIRIEAELAHYIKENNQIKEQLIAYKDELKYKDKTLATLDEEVKGEKEIIRKQEEETLKLEEAIADLEEKLNSKIKLINSLESENLELIKKNKNYLITQENFQNDVVKQNQTLLISERKLMEKVEKLSDEMEGIRLEREKIKSLMNEAIEKSSELLMDKNSLEQEIAIKNSKIESLKNANLILHKRMVINHSNSIGVGSGVTQGSGFGLKDTEKTDLVNMSGLSNVKETQIYLKKVDNDEDSIVNQLRKDKEKSQEYLDEIRKIKQNINSLN